MNIYQDIEKIGMLSICSSNNPERACLPIANSQ
jgi:hypothetical protein